MDKKKEDRQLTWEEFEERLDSIYEQIQQLIKDTNGQK